MPPNPQTTSGWRVTSQIETYDLDDSGKAGPGVRIEFVTARSQHGSVFVPRALYNEVNARAAIMAKVGTMHGVLDLTG